MKIMKKALALFIALIMVLGTVPTFAADNGETIDLIGFFTSDANGESPIATTGNPSDVVVNQGETVYLHVKFANNPTTLPVSACDITILMDYDSNKVEVKNAYAMDVATQVQPTWNGESIIISAWADTAGITYRGSILAEGTVYTAELLALTDLTEDDLAKIKPLESASSIDKDGNPATQRTFVKDKVGDLFTDTWSANVQEKVLPAVITIDETSFTVNTSDKEWTGEQIKPAVTSNIAALVEDTHYTVAYGANTNLGTGAGTITISLKDPDADGYVWVGDQRYTGSASYTFNIVEKAIKESDFDWSNVATTVYTGSQITPVVESTTGLVAKQDYEVTYGNNTTAAENGTVTVTGINNYSGSFTKHFDIKEKAIVESDFEFDLSEQEFDGTAIKPEVTPLTGLIEGQDYTVDYSNNSMAGVKGNIIVKGINNYTGTITKQFQIKAEQLAADGEITLGYAFTSIGENDTSYDPEARISSVTSGQKFVIWVNVGNNGTTSSKETITAYDLLLQYDTAAIKLNTCADAATNPEVKLDFNANTVIASWANNKGITSGMPAKLQKEATLFVIEAEALTDLDAAALNGVIDYVATATNTAGDNIQKTSFIKLDGTPYNIVDGEDAVVQITNSHVVIDTAKDYVYTGSEIIPDITALNKIDESEFEITYANNIDVGKATATVTGKGKFYGSFDVEFNIKPKNIEDGDIDFALAETKIVYTGEELKPAVISDLVEGTANDYTVAYTNNVEYGQATVTITGVNNYTGEVVLHFDIVKNELKDSYFTVKASEEYKDGTPITIDSVADLFTADGLLEGAAEDFTVAYYNNVNVGTATLVFTGVNNYVGTVTKTFEITARTLTAADFTVADATYTGKEIIPTVTTTLTEGTDYIVVYSDNVNAGTATATFTGKGNYTGKVPVNFTIAPVTTLPDDAITVEVLTDAVYTGLPIEPIVSSSELVEGRDYEVRYENNINAGEATVKIIGKGNYEGYSKEVKFAIAQKEITDGDFALAATEVVYTGSAITPDVITMLVKDTDFTVDYGTDNVEVGDVTVTIEGKGNYKGTKTKTFKIVPKAITEADFTFDLTNKTYTGTAIEPGVTPETGLALGTDYEVTYLNNTNAGTATIAVAGKGNYTGNISHVFTIDPKAIVDADFTFGNPADWYEAKKQAGELADGIEPGVTTTLLDGDYEVIYTNNNAAGTATITVKGTGNYKGTVTHTFEINTYRLGDVDNDATWSTIDAVRILKMATDLYTNPTELEKIAANVVADGAYNARDALEVLKYSALLEGTISQYYLENFSN